MGQNWRPYVLFHLGAELLRTQTKSGVTPGKSSANFLIPSITSSDVVEGPRFGLATRCSSRSLAAPATRSAVALISSSVLTRACTDSQDIVCGRPGR